jgi:hypothetical protein
MHLPLNRAFAQIKDIIATLQLELNGQVVLTEVASGAFAYTPIIAAMAGAEKVYAWSRDSTYGKAEDHVANCQQLFSNFNMDKHVVEFAINDRPKAHIQVADIVTNLGFVRPLNLAFLEALHPQAVIAYMSEAWEVRPNDIDIAYCKKRGIRIAGTWENHPHLNIFDACGPLALKLCFDAGYEVYQNRILIVSNDAFGTVAHKALSAMNPTEIVLSSIDEAQRRTEWNFDFILIADYTSTSEFIGHNGIITPRSIEGCGVVHLAGKVDVQFAIDNGISVFPEKEGVDHRMTETLAYLGTKPVIDLHAAGLKVGELLRKGKASDLIQPIC